MRRFLDILIIILLLWLVCAHENKFLGLFVERMPEPAQHKISFKEDAGGKFTFDDVKAIFPDATYAAQNDQGLFEVTINGKLLGFLATSSPYSDKVSGFMGPTPLLIGLDKNLRICKVIALENNETPHFFEAVKKGGLLEAWNGLLPAEVADKKVDAVTGATYSSNGVIDSMKARMAALGDIQPAPTAHDWWLIASNICFLLLLAVSLFGFFRPRLLGKWRVALVGASIIVLAIWQGRMLSMAQFTVWLLNGIPMAVQWTIALLFLLSIAMPLIFGKAYYCAWLCPFGAAQELLGMINRKHKVRLGNAILQWLQFIRTAVLFGILLVMGLGLSFGFGDFEAFSVFHPSTAPKVALVLGAVSLLASLWLPRPWCRFLCPLGELLETFRRQKS